jgi:hypothetical protein
LVSFRGFLSKIIFLHGEIFLNFHKSSFALRSVSIGLFDNFSDLQASKFQPCGASWKIGGTFASKNTFDTPKKFSIFFTKE